MATVLVPLAPGCEELEAITVIDLLCRACITAVAADFEAGPVVASRALVLVPETFLDEVLEQDFDMIVLPGGAGGTQRLEADDWIRQLSRRLAATGGYTAAICTAPKVLATAGLLKGRQATACPACSQARPPSFRTAR
jgi:4-methyl-5(b-hydroxyethyl)-thiazole monophosphate biosynthesis